MERLIGFTLAILILISITSRLDSSSGVPQHSAAATPQVIASPTSKDREDLAVYETIFSELVAGEITSMMSSAKENVELIVLKDHTVQFKKGSCLDFDNIESRIIKQGVLDSVTLKDFKQRNSAPLKITNPLFYTSRYRLISDKDLKRFQQGEAFRWKYFYNEYSGAPGITEISMIGYNTSKTMALVYMGNHSGQNLGDGNYYVMNKIQQRWVIQKRARAWVI